MKKKTYLDIHSNCELLDFQVSLVSISYNTAWEMDYSSLFGRKDMEFHNLLLRESTISFSRRIASERLPL